MSTNSHMTRGLMGIGAGVLALSACQLQRDSEFRTTYVLESVPDTFGTGDYGWILHEKRLILEGQPTRGRAQFRSVNSWGARARVLPDGSLRPDTVVVDGQFTRRRDTLTVTWHVGPASPNGMGYESFVVDDGGSQLTTVASGPVFGTAILRVSRYRRVAPPSNGGPHAP